MHLTRVTLRSRDFPTRQRYPFNLAALHIDPVLDFTTPITLLVGDNGSGKSTVLDAIARRCGIPIWGDDDITRTERNPDARKLRDYLDVTWAHGRVPGAFFSALGYRRFTEMLEEFAATDPGQLRYFGGASLVTLSHGQSLMSYFRARFRIPGLYLLDEPESALSPRTLLAFINDIHAMASLGHAQFIMCTHSPMIMACPGASLYSFDGDRITPIACHETDHYRLYADFMRNPSAYFPASSR